MQHRAVPNCILCVLAVLPGPSASLTTLQVALNEGIVTFGLAIPTIMFILLRRWPLMKAAVWSRDLRHQRHRDGKYGPAVLHGLIEAIQQSYPYSRNHRQHWCRRSRLTTPTYPTWTRPDRRLQHGPSGCYASSWASASSTPPRPSRAATASARGLLHQRRHPPQERRPQGSAELSPHPPCRPRTAAPDTNNIPTRTMGYVSNPSSAVARSQLGGCQLQRESGRECQHRRALRARAPARTKSTRPATVWTRTAAAL